MRRTDTVSCDAGMPSCDASEELSDNFAASLAAAASSSMSLPGVAIVVSRVVN